MLPGMSNTLTPAERLRQDGVLHRLRDGRRVIMWSGVHPTRGRIVIVKPIGRDRDATPR